VCERERECLYVCSGAFLHKRDLDHVEDTQDV